VPNYLSKLNSLFNRKINVPPYSFAWTHSAIQWFIMSVTSVQDSSCPGFGSKLVTLPWHWFLWYPEPLRLDKVKMSWFGGELVSRLGGHVYGVPVGVGVGYRIFQPTNIYVPSPIVSVPRKT
jgi:hypothetical protein